MALGDKAPPATIQTWQPMGVHPKLGSVSAENGFDKGFLPGTEEHFPTRPRRAARKGAQRAVQLPTRARQSASPASRALRSLSALAVAGGMGTTWLRGSWLLHPGGGGWLPRQGCVEQSLFSPPTLFPKPFFITFFFFFFFLAIHSAERGGGHEQPLSRGVAPSPRFPSREQRQCRPAG